MEMVEVFQKDTVKTFTTLVAEMRNREGQLRFDNDSVMEFMESEYII